MDEFLNKYYFLKSRKFWAFIGGVLSLYLATAQMHPFPIDTFVQGLVALVLGYIGTVAWEDSAAKKADGMVQAAAMTANTQASTTTVSTPGGSDVTVTAPPDAAPAPFPKGGQMLVSGGTNAPTQPVIGTMGLP